VCHGVTGYVVETVAEMAEAVQHVSEMDPNCCRRYVEQNFAVSRLADNYLAAYETVLTAGALPPDCSSITSGILVSDQQ
jgi:glycosyltransferase involved in cell wall biosynthesis